MIARIVGELGPWNWVAIGLVLLVMEIALPGVFLLWFGMAAIVVGALSIMFHNAAFWPWEAQIVVFLILSLVMAYFGKRMMDKGDVTDEPLLNKRSEQLIGRTATLGEPIKEGYGRIRIDDSQWRVKGPDLPAGARVKISAVDGGELVVEAA
jgi:membrane protein implicated in regulation of membrane protease activity